MGQRQGDGLAGVCTVLFKQTLQFRIGQDLEGQAAPHQKLLFGHPVFLLIIDHMGDRFPVHIYKLKTADSGIERKHKSSSFIVQDNRAHSAASCCKNLRALLCQARIWFEGTW